MPGLDTPLCGFSATGADGLCAECDTRDQCYTGFMANLTISVDDQVLRRARIRALQRNESVNRYLAETLERYADGDDGSAAEALIALARSVNTGHVGEGRGWTREELHRG